MHVVNKFFDSKCPVIGCWCPSPITGFHEKYSFQKT